MVRSRLVSLCVVSLLITVLTASPVMAACANPVFLQLPSITTGHDVGEFAVGDVNNDGEVDLVTVSFTNNDIKVRLGNGDGTFGLPLTYSAPSPQDVVLGDLDNDAFLDIIVSSEPGQTEECTSFGSCAGYSVLLNDGDGSFGSATTTPVPFASSIVALDVADFTTDGNRDLLVAAPPLNTADPALHVFFGNGTGSLPTRQSWAVNGPVLDAMAVNLTGGAAQPDVVAAVGPGTSSTFTRVIVYPSQSGTFPASSATRNIAETNAEVHLASGDFNLNGKLDIALTFMYSPGGWGAAVILANGNSSLAGVSSFAHTSPALTDIAVADVDEDGVLDVMTAFNANGWKAFMWNGSNSNFFFDEQQAVRQGSFTSGATKRVIANDFDHDGRTDFFFLDTSNDAVVVLESTCNSRFSTVTLSSSPNPSTYNSNATFTITVQPKPNAPVPTGSVTLWEGANQLGRTTLNASGIGIITLSNLSTGAHTLHATYTGDGNFASQTSPNYSHTVVLPPFGAPLNVTATGNGAANQITVRWTATADSASHDVLRRLNGAWSVIAPGVTGEVYIDSNVVNTSAYVYAVQSHSTGGAISGISNSDIGTTATLALPSDHKIRATDVTTTRTLVNSLRSAAGLTAFTFTDASLTGVKVKAVHVTDLRTALNQARTTLGFSAMTFTNPTLTPNVTPVRLVDLQEIRNSLQ
jgi:hypothetical protein